MVEVDGEGGHVEEEAGQGAEQGDGGEEEGGEGTPEKVIKSIKTNLAKNKKGGRGTVKSRGRTTTRGRRLRRLMIHLGRSTRKNRTGEEEISEDRKRFTDSQGKWEERT